MILKVAHIEVGRLNRLKNNEKSKSKIRRLLARIFPGFYFVLGGKLASKIEPRSRKTVPKRHQKNDDNLKAKKTVKTAR